MSTRFDYESSIPLLEFFENEDQEEEARARKRFRRVTGPPSRSRRFNFANRNRQLLKPRRSTRRFIRPFPRPFPRPAFPFPRPFPWPAPGWGTSVQPVRPPDTQGSPGSGSSGYAAAMDDDWGPEGALPHGPDQGPPEGIGQTPSADDGAEPGADSTHGDDAQPGGDEELFEFFPESEYGDIEFGLTPEFESWQSQLSRGRSRRRGRCNCHRARSNIRASRLSGNGSRPRIGWQGEATGFQYETNASGFPQSVITLVKRGLVSAGLKLAISLGFRSEAQLTNLVFFLRHPERGGRAIAAGEPNYSGLVREWIAIRDREVRPALLGGAAPSGSGSTARPPSFPYQSTTVTPTPTSGALDIVKVRGINVARQIAPQVEGLLASAEAAGISLSGGGYRSREAQIELRKKHCGTTQFDIFEKPSSQCTPPTAPPGRSQHEKGLAIDFTYGGTTIKSQSSPAFQWLKANAARFGLYNLPSEPWHWSVDGR